MILKAKTACGDDANSPPNTGLCSKKSVFQCVLTEGLASGKKTLGGWAPT